MTPSFKRVTSYIENLPFLFKFCEVQMEFAMEKEPHNGFNGISVKKLRLLRLVHAQKLCALCIFQSWYNCKCVKCGPTHKKID